MSCFLFLWVLFIWKATPWAPRSLRGLVAVSSSETGPGFKTVDWAMGLLASSHPISCRIGGPVLLFPCHHARMGSGCFPSQLSWSSTEATVLTANGYTDATSHQPLCIKPRLLLHHLTAVASTARVGPAGIPDNTRELSGTKALGSPSLVPNCSHQQVLHHPSPRAQLLMTMVTRAKP